MFEAAMRLRGSAQKKRTKIMVNLCVLCDGNDNCLFRARTTGIGKFHE